MSIRFPTGFDPVLVACAGFLLGVLAHAMRPFGETPLWAFSFLVVIGLIIWIASGTTIRRLRQSEIRLAPASAILMLAFAFGLIRHDATLPRGDDPLLKRRGAEVAFIGRAVDVRQYDALFAIESINGRRVQSRSRVLLAKGRAYPRVGETWTVTCRVESAIAFDENGPSRTATFNARDGAFFACKGTVTARKIGDPRWWDPRAMIGTMRAVMTSRIRMILPGDEGALLAGILYGERNLSENAAAAFRFAGMTHLIAVSGSNVTIVVACLVPIFLAIGYRRRASILFSIIGIFAFVLFVGASASVVRAAFMGSLAIFARAVGRRAQAARLLLLAGAVLVAFRPWMLAFDAGFALSFLATAGLIAWSEPIGERLRFIPEAFGLRDAATTTLAATLATFPYQLWAFSSASLAGLFTNLIVLPFLGATMAFGAVALALGEAIPFAALPVHGLLRFMLLVAETSERFPFFLVPMRLPTLGLFSTYAFLTFIFARTLGKKTGYPQNSEKPTLF